MVQTMGKYRKGTRAARFLVIRDAILSSSHSMRQIGPGRREMAVGPFLIHYSIPGVWGPGRPFNLAIWPGGAQDSGYVMQANKVANVDWDQGNNVDILSFRSGPWEDELLSLLSADNLSFLQR